jgi:hypothetical protein
MGTFHPRLRLAIAVLGLAGAGAVALYANAVGRGLSLALGDAVEQAADGVLIAAALYLANWILAWVYRASWPVTLGRCLVFAVVAYVGVSSLVDLFGENRGLAWQILGAESPGDPALVAALRARGVCHATVIALAAIAIGFGFERRRDDGSEEGPDQRPEDDDGGDDGGGGGDERR